jgi:hypothetical protein
MMQADGADMIDRRIQKVSIGWSNRARVHPILPALTRHGNNAIMRQANNPGSLPSPDFT